MKHPDDAALIPFRTPGPCEACGRWCQQREAHHVHSRGAGQLDLAINLLGLGGAWSCNCHRHAHNGNPSRRKLIEVVAKREGLDPDFLEEQIHRLRRAPKGCRVCPRCLGAGTVKLWKSHRPAVFSRWECVCGGGILGPDGEAWVEPERRLAGT